MEYPLLSIYLVTVTNPPAPSVEYQKYKSCNYICIKFYYYFPAPFHSFPWTGSLLAGTKELRRIITVMWHHKILEEGEFLFDIRLIERKVLFSIPFSNDFSLKNILLLAGFRWHDCFRCLHYILWNQNMVDIFCIIRSKSNTRRKM